MATPHAPWLVIVGIGEDGLDGLSPAARSALGAAETVFGGERHLNLAKVNGTRGQVWASPFQAGIEMLLTKRGRPTVVLATGDPMHFGVGASLMHHLAPEEFLVLPHVSAFSLAANRLGWPLQDTGLLSLHGRPIELLHPHLQPGARLLVLTSCGSQVSDIAALLTARGFGPSRLVVMENMGGVTERCVPFGADAVPSEVFSDLTTLAIDCLLAPGTAVLPRVPGLPDDAFRHDGQLTKREVRAATVSALMPAPGALLWDVGAGCGSVAIEWMRAERNAGALCFEQDGERLAMIDENRLALGAPSLEIVPGSVPETLIGQPAPDAVFMGGAVIEDPVFEACWAGLKPLGRLVANAVTLEGEAALVARHDRFGGDLVRIDVSHLTSVGRFRALKPRMAVLQWRTTKPWENAT